MTTHIKVDATRLLCPLPVIELQNTIQPLMPGDTIELIATDPGVQYDIPAWCQIHGHIVTQQCKQEGTFTFVIERGDLKANMAKSSS